MQQAICLKASWPKWGSEAQQPTIEGILMFNNKFLIRILKTQLKAARSIIFKLLGEVFSNLLARLNGTICTVSGDVTEFQL